MTKKIKNWYNLFQLIDAGLVYVHVRKNSFKQFTNVYIDYFFCDGSLLTSSTFNTFARHLSGYSNGMMEAYDYAKAHHITNLKPSSLNTEEIEQYKETVETIHN